MIRINQPTQIGNRWIDQETIWQADRALYQPGAENGAAARIAFDGRGFVYMTIGQFTDYSGVQDLSRPDGKTIRVHDDGRIPEDNRTGRRFCSVPYPPGRHQIFPNRLSQ